ncbi:MAG: PadR family transcriptional regulator [Clostridiales bacterium]|nr:PadR family transcriptional regulator [Clostridiales bacterium]
MAFPVSSTLLDAMVLSIVHDEDTYGYKITQDIREAMDVSESTLYPVLRRLQKEECLETYDKEYMGRNRRYYKVTSKGKAALNLYREDWKLHKEKVDTLLNERGKNDE